MKKKYIFIALGIILFIVLIVVAWVKPRKEMPNIVFSYNIYDRLEDSYKIYMIDNKGNVYYSQDSEFLCHYSELDEKYSSGEIASKGRIIQRIDMTQLQEKFKAFRSIVNKGDYHLIDNEVEAPTEVVPIHSWYGYYYNMYGEIQYIELYYKREYVLESKDERAKELADWISEVCNIK